MLPSQTRNWSSRALARRNLCMTYTADGLSHKPVGSGHKKLIGRSGSPMVRRFVQISGHTAPDKQYSTMPARK
jgi:hypothetical protein